MNLFIQLNLHQKRLHSNSKLAHCIYKQRSAKNILSNSYSQTLPRPYIKCYQQKVGLERSSGRLYSVYNDVQRPKVCIIGGGFGGLYTALKIQDLLWPKGLKPEVTLIDKLDRFNYKPLLYELLNNTASIDEVAPKYASLLEPKGVQFIQGQVDKVQIYDDQSKLQQDGMGGEVVYTDKLQNTTDRTFDYLVVGVGTQTSLQMAPGVRENAVGFNTYQDVLKIKERIQKLPLNSKVVVVGGGYTGVELAAVLVDLFQNKHQVEIISSGQELVPNVPPQLQANLVDMVTKSGVKITLDAKVTGIRGDVNNKDKKILSLEYETQDQQGGNEGEVEANLVVWSVVAPATKAVNDDTYPFELNKRGLIITDKFLRVQDSQRVFALGDVSSISDPGAYLPPNQTGTAQVAMQQADFTAWNIWAVINNRELLPFRYQHIGNMVSLGRFDAVVNIALPLPPPLAQIFEPNSSQSQFLENFGFKIQTDRQGITLQGGPAQFLRRFAYWFRLPTDAQRVNSIQHFTQNFQSEFAKQRK